MELNYDWKSFQSFFYPKKRISPNESNSTGPIYLVVEERIVVSAFSEGDDLSDWIGATRDEVTAEHLQRDLIFYDRDKVDQCMNSAIGLPHYFDQTQLIREESKPHFVGRARLKNHEAWVKKNFLLQTIQGWWQKIFPSRYGLYIHLAGEHQTSQLLLVIQRGKVNSFHVPDLSSMIRERREHPSDVIKHLSSKYLLPVQGLFVTASEWSQWSEDATPWPKILKALQANKNKLVPYKWSLAILIRIKAYFGI